VTQILINLLSNAYKYTPDGGTITLQTGRDSNFVWASVSDTGIGLTPEQIAKLGTKFWRADDAHVTKQSGSGLGLTITWNLLRLMGGDMGVTSVPGEGSTFMMTLPVAHTHG
jgi:signal transduction histidine kinase